MSLSDRFKALVGAVLQSLTRAIERLGNRREAAQNMHASKMANYGKLFRVLIVESDPSLAATLVRSFSITGRVVRHANNLDEGMAESETFCPHMAVIDLVSSAVQGQTLAHFLRSRFGPRILIVGLTYNSTANVSAANQYPFDVTIGRSRDVQEELQHLFRDA